MSPTQIPIPAEVYEKWLDIPQFLCPPDYYTLLGLEPGESDLTVIKHAADERIKRIRPKCLKHRELGTQLLNEIARARVCLTSTLAKAEYDAALESGGTLMFEDSATAARLRAMRWSEVDLAPLLGEAAPTQVSQPAALDVEAAQPESLEALNVPDVFAMDVSPAAAVSTPHPVPKEHARATASGQPQPIKCPCCNQFTAAGTHWNPLSVKFDAAGDLTSAVCSIRQRRTRLLLRVSIDAEPLGWDKPVLHSILTKHGVAALGLAVLAAGLTLGLLVLPGIVENPLAPVTILGLMGLVLIAVLGGLYRPPINSAEDAAWMLVVPWLLKKNRLLEHFDLVAGLAIASASRPGARSSGNPDSRTAGTEALWATADKRRAIVERCLVFARSLAGEGHIPHDSVGLLYRLLIVDRLRLGDPQQQLPSVLEQLLGDCLGKKLPLSCLDVAVAPNQVVHSLRPEVSRWFLIEFFEKCLQRGHNSNEIAALAGDSAAISQLLSRMSFSPAEAISFLTTLSRTCREGLGRLAGATVFEFTSARQFTRLRECPDLLALKHDETVALRMSGFYFLGVRYVSKPKIWVSNSPRGYQLHVGRRSFFYPDDPGELGGRVVAWAQLYFHTILPAVQEELAREPSPERLRHTRSVVITCPHCHKLFGGVLVPESAKH